MKKYKLEFPRDESKHDTIGEWWYFNGNLKDKNGRQYSYMNTLFRVALPLGKTNITSKLPKLDNYFYHSIITDVETNKFYPHMNYIVRSSNDSFVREGLNVYFSPAKIANPTCYFMEQLDKNRYQIKGERMRLELTSQKPPLLENQTGYVNLFKRPTFYYSLTSLDTKGILIINGKQIEVEGKSWMDHQWSDTSDVTKDFWNWFSIQLDNDVEIVCYEYGHDGQSAFLATIINPDGTQKSFDKVVLTPLNNKWQSPKSKAVYDLSWNIKIPGAEIELEVRSKVKDHEMNFLNINYWESPIEVKAAIKGKQANGFGYMELAGRPSIFNNLGCLKSELINKVLPKNLTEN